MKLIFIRHGDPDYRYDSLTEKGRREVELLNTRVKNLQIDRCYVSPLGRAKATAEAGLRGTGIVPVEKEWLREFSPRIRRPDGHDELSAVCWDWLPKDFTERIDLFDREKWASDPIMAEADVGGEYDRVCAEFDRLLEENGYVRDGMLYRAVRPNNDTLVFFCHFGVSMVLLSHLINVSPMVLWQGISAAPTSVTSVITEERREGTVYFRANMIGDISHLYVADEPPAFSARFCECYGNADERHD